MKLYAIFAVLVVFVTVFNVVIETAWVPGWNFNYPFRSSTRAANRTYQNQTRYQEQRIGVGAGRNGAGRSYNGTNLNRKNQEFFRMHRMNNYTKF